jgi:hypothetical protein
VAVGDPAANRLPAAERYLRDPVFHHLVDTMLAAIQGGVFTPTEIREAAILAATIHERERPFRINILDTGQVPPGWRTGVDWGRPEGEGEGGG